MGDVRSNRPDLAPPKRASLARTMASAKKQSVKKVVGKKAAAKKASPKKPAKKVVKAAKPAKAPAKKAAPAKAAPAKAHVAAKPAAQASSGCPERCLVCGDACSRPGMHEQHRCGVHVGMSA